MGRSSWSMATARAHSTAETGSHLQDPARSHLREGGGEVRGPQILAAVGRGRSPDCGPYPGPGGRPAGGSGAHYPAPRFPGVPGRFAAGPAPGAAGSGRSFDDCPAPGHRTRVPGLVADYDFVGRNPVSRALSRLWNCWKARAWSTKLGIWSLFTRVCASARRPWITRRPRQKVLLELYERFFRVALKKDAERLGIVYTL